MKAVMSVIENKPCRLCYTNGTSHVDACTLKLDGWNIPLAIHSLFHFWIKSTDHLPTVICSDCLKLVKILYNFSVKVKQVQKELHKKAKLKKFPSFIENRQGNNVLIKPCKINLECITSEFIQADVKQELQREASCHISHEDPLDENITIKEEVKCDLPLDGENVSSITDIQLHNEVKESANILRDRLKKVKIKRISSSEIVNSVDDNDIVKDTSENSEGDTVSVGVYHNIDDVEFPSELYKDGEIIVPDIDLDVFLNKFYSIRCEDCTDKKPFSNFDKLFQHYEAAHKKRGYVTCCDTKIYRRHLLVHHMIYHLQPTAYQCKLCSKIFQSPYLLVNHMKRHVPKSKRPYKCDLCEERFVSPTYLKNHKEVHVPPEKRNVYTCKYCDKIFTLLTSMKMHERNVHSRKFLCSVCGKYFGTKKTLETHQLVHEADGRHCVQCSYCDFVSKTKYSLAVHMKRHSVRIQCPQCSYTSHLNSRLKEHMLSAHSSQAPHACDICSKSFKKESLLKSHKIRHTGERKHTCPFCPMTFINRSNCYTHCKKMHAEAHADLMKGKKLENKLKMERKLEERAALKTTT